MGAPAPDHRRPAASLVVAGVALVALLAVVAIFVSVLVAPLAILVTFAVGFTAADRFVERRGGGERGGPAA